ncbi:hypothetical protein BT96DRAFT_950508 [Gymnopus androsaceus JB14]|uniref:Uncharacterized protein n=1 Tax=Gymnopus androsaceus JB14 TaxID=1447944 RepID=A0A6A4GGB3_9AGAR|nr:hypothetical protein BT96DRAFT_950508 [Gymnopus androsaceus JB14]
MVVMEQTGDQLQKEAEPEAVEPEEPEAAEPEVAEPEEHEAAKPHWPAEKTVLEAVVEAEEEPDLVKKIRKDCQLQADSAEKIDSRGLGHSETQEIVMPVAKHP